MPIYEHGPEPESDDEQNRRAKKEREEESDRRAAEEDKKGGWGPFRPFSEWGKSDPEPDRKSHDHDDGESPSHRKSTDAGM